MDKQHSAQPNTYRPPFNPANRFPQYKISIPEKKTSPELVSKLFLTVAEGNYLKIKEFILANQVSMISKNETGESVLHLIIKNSNITEQEKLQLVRFCIEKGAQVTSYDQNNVTPLHLACKFQLVGVVNFFIEKNSKFKTKDNK
jgi:ankyrin repeat protein